MAKGKHYRSKNSVPYQPSRDIDESIYIHAAAERPEESTHIVNTNEDLHQSASYAAVHTANPPVQQYRTPAQQLYPQQPIRRKKSIVPPLLACLFLLAALGIVIYMLWSMDIFGMLQAFLG